MDLLDQSVLPQSSHHMLLLRYLLGLTYFLFLPYVSILFGSLCYSLFFRGKADKSGDKIYKRFAKDLIDLVTFNKSVGFALGIVPLLSSVFGYAQLLHGTGLNVPEYLFFSLLALTVSLFLVYTYKYTFHLKDIFSYAGGKNAAGEDEFREEIESYSIKAGRLYKQSGFYSIIFLMLSVYLYTASINLALDTQKWESRNDIFGLLFSLTALTDFLLFIAASFAITSGIIIYRFFRPNSEAAPSDDSYLSYIKKFSLWTGLTATVILPVLIVSSSLARPANTLSYDFFIAAAVSLIVLLLISILFYIMLKESAVGAGEKKANYSSVILFLLVIVFVVLVIKDQFAFDTSTKMQTEILAKQYDAYQAKLQEELGISVPISGADIYNGRCIACHNFDKKIVGPPYNSTLPKYVGKRELLIKYILNPVKVNPDYPAMPNQGLKPKEAEAIADYLLTTYKK